MSPITPPHQRPPTIDPVAVARWQRAAPPATPWLHAEVASRMLDRLQWIKLQPQAWAHWGALRGGLAAHAQLVERYPAARCHVIEGEAQRQELARAALRRPWWKQLPWSNGKPLHESPAPGSLNMLWANMALHESEDPQALLSQWQRLMAVDGFMMFSCLGPDSARELRGLYAELGWPPSSHELTDMHDWGDMLVATGFAEPVMDMERITLTYETPARLLQELTELGRNFHPARFPALRGRQWRVRLESLIDKHLPRAPDGRLMLTFELIYGHALKARPRVKVAAQSAVSIEDMRSLLHSPQNSPGKLPADR